MSNKSSTIKMPTAKAKEFLDRFARAFYSDAKIAFKISNTHAKNRFILCLYVPSLNAKLHVYAVKCCKYDANIYVPLDKLFMQANPEIMLRDHVFITMEDLVSKYGLDADCVAKKVFDALRKEFNGGKDLRGNESSSNSFKAVASNDDDTIVLKFASTFEEFMVNVDLDVK